MIIWRCLLVAIFTVFFVPSAFAQGDYLNKGENGVEVIGGYASSGDNYGLSGQVSFSFSSEIDIGCGFIAMSSSSGELDGESAYSPFIMFNLVKKYHQKGSYGAAFIAGYVKNTGKTDNRLQIMAGFATYLNSQTSQGVSVQPNVQIIFSPNLSGDGKFGLRPTIGFGMSAFVDLGKSRKSVLRIDPAISFFEGEPAFGIGVGLIFPFK